MPIYTMYLDSTVGYGQLDYEIFLSSFLLVGISRVSSKKNAGPMANQFKTNSRHSRLDK
jgi:hypothetical protein